jgi:hypothetical protein
MPPSVLAPPGRVNIIERRMPGCTAIFAQVIEYCERGHAAFPGWPASGHHRWVWRPLSLARPAAHPADIRFE